jgi:hypothetical protein
MRMGLLWTVFTIHTRSGASHYCDIAGEIESWRRNHDRIYVIVAIYEGSRMTASAL